MDERAEALDAEKLRLFEGATGVFFTGGDQLRITSQLGDTPVEKVRAIHAAGGVIAGTSAGASAMSDTMLVQGSSRETHRIGDLHLAPGFGLVRDVIIDQHFAERGRIGRLLGAIPQNPREPGLGIDEDTAAVLEGNRFQVIGSGGVYVVDGGASAIATLPRRSGNQPCPSTACACTCWHRATVSICATVVRPRRNAVGCRDETTRRRGRPPARTYTDRERAKAAVASSRFPRKIPVREVLKQVPEGTNSGSDPEGVGPGRVGLGVLRAGPI